MAHTAHLWTVRLKDTRDARHRFSLIAAAERFVRLFFASLVVLKEASEIP